MGLEVLARCCREEEMESGLIHAAEDYVLFDCPGQVELFTHHTSLRNIFFRIQKMGYRVGLLTSLRLSTLLTSSNS